MPLVAVLVVSFLGGCATTNYDAIMASWQGSHYNEVIAAWGPPTQVLEDPPGQSMTWASTRTVYVPVGQLVVARNLASTRTFWVDADGIIYRWAWRGK